MKRESIDRSDKHIFNQEYVEDMAESKDLDYIYQQKLADLHRLPSSAVKNTQTYTT